MEGGDGETGEEVQERLRTIAELQLAAQGGQSSPAVEAHKGDDDDENDLGFEEMGLDARLLRALAKKGLSDPTPVQAKAVPLILEGKDVVARAKTGSGKTLSYLLPLVHKLLAEGVSKKGPSAVVLVPTRELCQQVYDEATSLAEYCGATLRVVQLATTMTTATLKMALARVPDILVATPARIAACVSQNVILPAVLQESLSMLVLDEADLLFSYGYEEDIRSLAVHIPRRCQCLLMSATASPDVDKLKKLVLHNPVTLTLTEEVDGSGDTSVVPKSVQQFSINCKSKDKLLYTLAILKYDLIQKKAILFVNTIEAGFRLKLFLEQFGIKSAVLNGELPQNSRLHILQQFNVGLFEHLIATDDGKSIQPVSTGGEGAEDAGEAKKKSKKAVGDAEFGVVRGIDFKNVRTVINYDMPEGVAGYIHRIGRTGRAGNAGISISLVSQEEEELLKQIKAEVSGEDEGSKPIVPFPLLSTTAVESLRYRAEDVMRGVTKVAVREARAKELRIEILNSERLKAHFEDNPTDLELLKHDKVLSKIAPAAHLKTVPEYLLDPTTEAASRAINLARAAMNLAQTSFVKRRKNKRVRVADPPTSFTKSTKRLKRDGRKGGKSEDGKSRSRNASKHKRRKRHFGQAQEVKLEQAPAMRLEQSQEMKLEPRRYSNACLDEEAEQARAVNCVRLLQESILSPQDEDDEYYTAGHLSRHPQSPYQYSLAIDSTAAKMVTAVINKCKLFQCVSSLFKNESQELLATLVGLHQILQNVLSSPCIVRFHETLKDVLLYTTKAFAFLEKLCFKALPHESTHGVKKAGVKMNEFACRFFNQTVKLCHDLNNNEASDLGCDSPRGERLSFGITTYVVPVHNSVQRLLKKKRVHIPLTDLETSMSEYNVELSYPRSWFSRDVAMSAKVESSDRGVSQTLHADRVNVEKGSWGWEYAQDTVLITYDDFVVANVASVTGGMLTFNKHSQRSSIKAFKSQRYRTSIQIVGASRIDLDLQDLFIKGVKEKELVCYKCFVNTAGREEVLGIYRFQPKQIKDEGMLHIVGRGNQPGLRHVLVSIFASLGFTPAA